MGMLIEGQWVQEDRIYQDGDFKRQASVFDHPLDAELAESIRAEPGRYHLIASQSCPWSHRVLLVRTLRRLEELLPLQIAHGPRLEGYAANAGAAWQVPGSEQQIVHMHELYSLADPRYSGRVTVPVLWDSASQCILSNESARIIRLLDLVPAGEGASDFTLMPRKLSQELDELNQRIQAELCNAVYRAGLARRQDVYDVAVEEVFSMLEELEHRLSSKRYLFGKILTEADLRLLPSLLRFDSVYHGYFRCSHKRLTDYPNLWAYTRDLYSWCGVAETTDFQVIRAGYFLNDGDGNPYGIIPVAPEIDWFEPHGRDALSQACLTSRSEEIFSIDPVRLLHSGEA